MDEADVVPELHRLAGWHGLPGAIEFTLDRLPGSLTADVGYDLAVRLGLLAGDLAHVLTTDPRPGPAAEPSGSHGHPTFGCRSSTDGSDPDAAGPRASTDPCVCPGGTVSAAAAPSRGDEADPIPGTEPSTSVLDTGHGSRAREGEGDDGVVASAMVAAVLRPVIHPWMVVDPAIVRHAVGRLDEVGPRLLAALRALHLDTEAVEQVRLALSQARTAFAGLADALAVDGAHVRRLTHRLVAARDMRPHTDRLTAADVACRDTLTAVTRLVPSVADLLRGTPWDPAPAPIDVDALSDLGTEAVAAALARRPALLDRVTDPGRDAAPPWLVPVLHPQGGAAEGEVAAPTGDSLQRVARVRDACARQDEESLHRAALLYPRLLGRLDGVPLRWRFLANRLVMRADLERLRVADLAVQQSILEQRVEDAASPWRRLRGAVLDAWMASDAAVSMATMPHDRLAPRRADLRAMIRLTHELLHDHVDHGRGRLGHRQVVQYDRGGRVVELWGHLDDRTRQVGVYVGGTGTTPRQFGWPTGIARALQQAEAPESTAVLTWMGAEFPNAIGTQSPQGRFARAAAVPLRDCVEGLDVPDDVPITVVGHSYGGVVVGAAEAVGLRVDRVVHAGVPGLGPGVRSVESYPSVDALGRARQVTRYALTAPGDLIRWWRRGDAVIESVTATWRVGPVTAASQRYFDLTLGADPTRAPGIVELDTGIWETDKNDRRSGEILFGPRGHADVVEPGTTSFRCIVAILHGRDPQLVTPRPDVTPFRWMPRPGGAPRPHRHD